MLRRQVLQIRRCGIATLLAICTFASAGAQSKSRDSQANRYVSGDQAISYSASAMAVSLGMPKLDESGDTQDTANKGDTANWEEVDLLQKASVGPIPMDSFWWTAEINAPLLESNNPQVQALSLDQLVIGALAASQRVRIAQIEGFVERELVTQEDANFDWTVFSENLFKGTNLPTGSDLEAGAGVARLIDDDFTRDSGIKRKNAFGGEFEANQKLRFYKSNSQFIDPNNQAFAELRLRYNQPLLREGGYLVNYGQVIVAELDANATTADSEADIVDIIEEVVRAYWELYRLRSQFVIQRRQVQQNQSLLKAIRQRTRIDAGPILLGQAEYELATQTSRLAAIRTDLIRAQLELVRAVGDRNLAQFSELIPIGQLPPFQMEVDSRQALSIALSSRPEIRAAGARIRRSELLKNISYRQLLPSLALIFETTVAGLNGDFDILKSLGDQFSEGGPGVSVGLNFEFPVGNRLARSRLRESQLKLARDVSELEDNVDKVRLDVEKAINGMAGARQQFNIRKESAVKSQAVVDSLIQRRNVFPREFDEISQLFVREILDAQRRTTTAELAVVDLVADYAIDAILLRKAMGILLSQFSQPAGPNQLLQSQPLPSSPSPDQLQPDQLPSPQNPNGPAPAPNMNRPQPEEVPSAAVQIGLPIEMSGLEAESSKGSGNLLTAGRNAKTRPAAVSLGLPIGSENISEPDPAPVLGAPFRDADHVP